MSHEQHPTPLAATLRQAKAALQQAKAAEYDLPGGPWDRPVLGQLLSRARSLGGTSLVDGALRLDARALDAAVQATSAALLRSGVRRGDIIAWQLPGSAAAVVLLHACWHNGFVPAPVHHRMGPAELQAALSQIAPRSILATENTPLSEMPATITLPSSCTLDDLLVSLGTSETSTTETLPPASPAVQGSDIALILFTSGSTGVPKAVLHTHRALSYKASLMVEAHGLHPGEGVLSPAPLAHISGILNGVLLPAAGSLRSILMSRWDPELGSRLLRDEQIAFMGAPPVFFVQMAELVSSHADPLPALRIISTGGASVSPSLVSRLRATYSCQVKRTYGSTEAPTITTARELDPPDRAMQTDGRPVGCVEISVRDANTSAELPAGQPGELWVRGPELFAGYIDAAATARATGEPGAWFRTGDLGVLDEGGWLTVTGRISDIIIRAGENIAASEVESALEAHPAVSHAVAVPVPDPVLGERVGVYVVASERLDLEACKRWFAERGVTRFKTPEYLEQLTAIPYLAAGKPDRAQLRERARLHWASRQPAS